MPRRKLPPLADERPQLRRWIAVDAEGQIYATDQAHSTGVELGPPYDDEIPPLPVSYWRGRKSEPKA